MLSPRLAARALILIDNKLLVVNAYPATQTAAEGDILWCAPGGGVERGASVPDNLRREIHEETGLEISVGPPVLVNEFHDPTGDFHQVDLYFRCSVQNGEIDPRWTDPAGVVRDRRLVTRDELSSLRHKPDSLRSVAWGEGNAITYDPLEPIIR